jgi:predicted membrane protein
MLLGALSLLLVCLLALLFFKYYKTRSRMKLSDSIPGPKALPLLGNFLEFLFYIGSKLHMIFYIKIRHKRQQRALRNFDLAVTMA